MNQEENKRKPERSDAEKPKRVEAGTESSRGKEQRAQREEVSRLARAISEREKEEIPFDEALWAMWVVGRIQDERPVTVVPEGVKEHVKPEAELVISEEKFDSIKTLLHRRGGLSKADISGMEDSEVVVLAQQVLLHNGILEPNDRDLEAIKDQGRKSVASSLAKEGVKKFSDEDEEMLTEDKVEEFLERRDTGERIKAEEEKPDKKGVEGAQNGEEVELGSILVESYPHLMNLSRPAVVSIFDNQGVTIDVPSNWDKMSVFARRKWLSENKIINTVQFPKTRVISGGAPEDGEPRERDPEAFASFEETVDELMRLAGAREGNPDRESDWWNTLSGSLETLEEQMGDSEDYRMASEIASKINELEYRASADADINRRLETFLNKARRDNFKAFRDEINKNLRESFASMDSKVKHRIFDDFDVAVNQLRRYMNFGYSLDRSLAASGLVDSVDEQGQAQPGLIEKLKRENPDYAGMIDWRYAKVIEGIRNLDLEEIRRQTPVDWRDSEQNVRNVFRLVESTDLALDQMRSQMQEGTKIALSIPVSSLEGAEQDEARVKQAELNELVDAVQAMYTFFDAMETYDMDPDKIGQVFQGFSDRTFKLYFERFSLNEQGERIEKKNKETGKVETLNVLDEAIKVYMRRLVEERRRMNEVEEMTKSGLNLGTGNEDERAIIRLLLKKEADFDLTKLSSGEQSEVNKLWSDLGRKKEVVSEWYRQNTLLGAHGQLKGEPESLLKKRRDELKVILTGGLGEKLVGEFGYTEEKADDLINSRLIDQVMNNAYRMVWSLAWSDYDGVRVWDPNAEALGHQRGRVADYVFNQNTSMFAGRAIDHTWEFYANEDRGKVGKTNLILQNHLLGKRGQLFAQNRTMVRFAAKLAAVSPTLRENFSGVIEDKIRRLKNIDKFGDLSDKNDRAWARGAAIAELIDDGDISFEDANWSEAFSGEDEETNIIKYSMIDLYGDRATHFKYIGKELLQAYLMNPSDNNFFKINSYENFYSAREVRLKPWMKLAIPAHLEIGDHWKEWWDMPYNMRHAEKDQIIEYSAETNRIEKEIQNWMKNKYLSWGPLGGRWGVGEFNVENTKALWETVTTIANETKKASPAIILAYILFMFAEIYRQSKAQLEGN